MKARVLFGFTALVVAAATATSIQVPYATAAAGKPSAGTERAQLAALDPTPSPNVLAKAASSWQANNTVWALAYANGVVYVGGQFTSVRPPGDKIGTGEVGRTFLAAVSSTTGNLVTPFNPVITGSSAAQVKALAVSPDGNTLYVGGNFDHVNGRYRDHLAAFDLTTGSLTSWAPPAAGTVLAIAVSPDGSHVYVGGDFLKLDGTARSYAGEVSASGTGALQGWAPRPNNPVTSIAVAPDDSRVIVGGYFTQFNGGTQNAIASTDPATGARKPFAATIVPNTTTCQSSVKDVIIGGATQSNPAGITYIAAEGTGGGCFDGDFAANVSDGSLIWQNDCLGATQAVVLINGWLFKGSHAHDCAYSAGGFPQVANPTGGWITHRLLDQSLTDGSVGHWNPNTNAGVNGGLGPRVMATDGTRLFLGGDFTTVNNKGQQGFAIFGPGPDTSTPPTPAAPTAVSTSSGVDSVTFSAVSTSDIGTLLYSIYRDSDTTPIGTLTETSFPWAIPVLHYRDAGLTPGSQHTYRVTVSNGNTTSAMSAASAAVTVASTNPPYSYPTTILRDHPSFVWTLGQTSGSTATDSTSHHFNGIYEPGTTKGAPGPITGSSTTATTFDGHRGLVTAAKAVAGPQTFTLEAWFKTSTNTGGTIIALGSKQTGLSPTHDRQIYMMNDGQLAFGVYNGSKPIIIESPRPYNDGRWHYVVARYNSASSSNNLDLYVDNMRIGRSYSSTAQKVTAGYWRVGGENLAGRWNLDHWGTNSQGTTEPLSFYIGATIGYVAVYPTALSAARIAAHYAANALSH
jgi:Concanavalin A-like lectin/glucanases superfamily/Domain of unknown function (DUF5122) beta-propeller